MTTVLNRTSRVSTSRPRPRPVDVTRARPPRRTGRGQLTGDAQRPGRTGMRRPTPASRGRLRAALPLQAVDGRERGPRRGIPRQPAVDRAHRSLQRGPVRRRRGEEEERGVVLARRPADGAQRGALVVREARHARPERLAAGGPEGRPLALAQGCEDLLVRDDRGDPRPQVDVGRERLARREGLVAVRHDPGEIALDRGDPSCVAPGRQIRCHPRAARGKCSMPAPTAGCRSTPAWSRPDSPPAPATAREAEDLLEPSGEDRDAGDAERIDPREHPVRQLTGEHPSLEGVAVDEERRQHGLEARDAEACRRRAPGCSRDRPSRPRTSAMVPFS